MNTETKAKRGAGYPFGEKPKGYPSKISRHISKNDWCHLCGQRVDFSADIWYPNNAEAVVRDGEDAPGPGHYVRICQGCACIIQDVISHVGK